MYRPHRFQLGEKFLCPQRSSALTPPQLDLDDAIGHTQTQVFSASALSGAVAAAILRNP